MFNMRIVIGILLLFFQIQLANAQDDSIYILNNNLYGDLKDGLPDNDTLVVLKKNNVVVGKGALAISEYGVSELRVGYWTEYSENGNLKMEGNYNLGSYIGCCTSGACRSFYYYRTGLWKIYDNEGKLEYELTFEPTEIHIETNCEGGDELLFGIIKEIPLKYWGELSSDKIFELQKIRREDDYSIGTWTPLNGRIFIESELKM